MRFHYSNYVIHGYGNYACTTCMLTYVFLFHCGLHWISYCPTCSVGALLYYYIIISYRMQREMNQWRKLIDTWQHCMRFVSEWYLVTIQSCRNFCQDKILLTTIEQHFNLSVVHVDSLITKDACRMVFDLNCFQS